MNDFEDIEIDGIGNLQDLASSTIEEIKGRLDPDEYALILPGEDIPEGWPPEIINEKVLTFPKEVANTKGHDWYMSLKEGHWFYYYALGTEYYRDKLQLIPAFIYCKEMSPSGQICYPIVSLLISVAGPITKASNSWCRQVMTERIEELKRKK